MDKEEIGTQEAAYRGKQFTLPTFSTEGAIIWEPNPGKNRVIIPSDEPVIQTLNTVFDLANFKVPRKPVSLGILPPHARKLMSAKLGAPRTLDLPIKFPGSNFRVPRELAQFVPVIKRAANFEAAVNARCYDEYYCYLTIDQGIIKPGRLQREAPCHVDGFQGARWRPKRRCNHTYTVRDRLPTSYYVQPFDFDLLDEAVHNFFWEMNYQVAQTNSAHVWQPQEYELTLMDCFCVHRGTVSVEKEELWGTFVRISFEERIFDRLGNAHNPLFKYDWPMVPRDIEELGLVAFHADSDPSLRVFPHEDLDGAPLAAGEKTQPNLRPRG